jgi:hypothetical protein
MTTPKNTPGARWAALATAGLLALGATAAHATTVTEDPNQGILPTFNQNHDPDFPTGALPDLDVQSASATFNGDSIFLSATMKGNIGTTEEPFYVWGIDRGAGTDVLNNPHTVITNTNPDDPTDPQPLIGEGVSFDAFLLLDTHGLARLVRLSTPNADLNDIVTPTGFDDLPEGSVVISGATISVRIPRSFVPSMGADISHYGYNIWPRYEGANTNTRVTDFLPDASTFEGSAVPEPAVWATMITGFGLAGATMRRRRRLTA